MSKRSISKVICRAGLFLGLLAGTAHADVAVAYWQTGGTGVGNQLVAAKSPVAVNQTTELGVVAPGQPALTLSGNFENRNAGAVHVAAVTMSIAAVRKAPGAAAGTCDRTDFKLGHRVMKVGADVPSGRATGAWTGATIEFRNKPGVDQNACMGAAVKLRAVAA